MIKPLPAACRTKIIFIEFTAITVLFLLSMEYAKKADLVVKMKNVCFITAFFGTIFIVSDIVLNFMNFLVSYSDLNRHSISFSLALSKIFDTSMAAIIYSTICIVLFLVLISLQRSGTLKYIWNYSSECCLLCILLAWLLYRITSSRYREHHSEHYSTCNTTGISYATGMAYSYYYGYLRVVLPFTGTTIKGIVERIENFEDQHNVTFATKKLLILCPASAYIPPDLKDHSNQWMESAIPLEADVRDRAGVKKRSYKNSVYKIYPGGRKVSTRPMYIVAEGATPLLTFYEIQKHSHPETDIFKEYSSEIVYNFYTKLKELIENDPECRNVCQLIYYDDRNSDDRPLNIAKIILDKVAPLNKVE